jgi:hypothetical protein
LVKKIKNCRISGSANLVNVLSLGKQVLTGVFPKDSSQKITAGPLDLVWCPDSRLLQLNHSYDLKEMYGMNYGYRSGLNPSMVLHLQNKVHSLLRLKEIKNGDIVLDIGSNDATLLSSYNTKGLKRVGIDPVGIKFEKYYSKDIKLIPNFFSAEVFNKNFFNKKASIITSIAMFYDLEDPSKFVKDIVEILDKDGIWHFEQSYMPAMLEMGLYDTICHEHLEYYSLYVTKNLVERHGLKIVDVQLNRINGGSFAVTASHINSKIKVNKSIIEWILEYENNLGLDKIKPYAEFAKKVLRHKNNLVNLIKKLNTDGKKVVAYGASTKGNVLLQFCGFTKNDISCIADVNVDKHGLMTPGTHIPILSENDVRSMKPDYMLVLPWHFSDFIINREAKYIASGGKLIFPFPTIEIF